jgi:hypothetical protein
LTLLGFAVLATVAAAPVFILGAWRQRVLAALFCVWPAWVLWRYCAWWIFVSRSK